MKTKSAKRRRIKTYVRGSSDKGLSSRGTFVNHESVAITQARNSIPLKTLNIIERSVARSGLSYEAFVKHITQTALAGLSVWSESDLERLLLSAERLGLDPLTNEIYATQGSDDPFSPVLLVVGINGWSKLLNSNPVFDGMRFSFAPCSKEEIPEWIECTIYRKDRTVPTTLREYFSEVKGESTAWVTHPRRMLRHKAMAQCARVCLGLVGVYDPDEAQRVQSARNAQKSDYQILGPKGKASSRTRAKYCNQEDLKKTLRAL